MSVNQGISSQGSPAAIPNEIRGWNWGACLLTWIWAIVYAPPKWIIIAFLPQVLPIPLYIGLMAATAIFGAGVLAAFYLLSGVLSVGGQMAINVVFGKKGSGWAWRSKKWESVEHFKRTQRTWKIWGIVAAGVGLALFTFIIVAMLMSGSWL
ncbi:MAG: hypothetical protein HY673_25165 [Chloroflexi bacterium]|nr:hypothetical protein [Chloroflexota bacterium]